MSSIYRRFLGTAKPVPKILPKDNGSTNAGSVGGKVDTERKLPSRRKSQKINGLRGVKRLGHGQTSATMNGQFLPVCGLTEPNRPFVRVETVGIDRRWCQTDEHKQQRCPTETTPPECQRHRIIGRRRMLDANENKQKQQQ